MLILQIKFEVQRNEVISQNQYSKQVTNPRFKLASHPKARVVL